MGVYREKIFRTAKKCESQASGETQPPAEGDDALQSGTKVGTKLLRKIATIQPVRWSA
jgi:hypothetical protein